MGVSKVVIWANAIFCPMIVALFIVVTVILQGEINHQRTTVQKALDTQHKQIINLHKLVRNTENSTITILNTTVVEVQESMQQEVASVGENTSKNILVQGAATFTVLCIMVFLWHLSSHLRNMHQPIIQRKILAVLWMTPIYATSALLMLILDNPLATEWIAVIKDFYEAYCIYMFLSLLIAILGRGDREEVVNLMTTRADHLRPPVHFCGFSPFLSRRKYEGNPHGFADAVLYQCQFCAMIYVFSRPVTSIGMAVSNTVLGTEWTWKSPQFIFVIMQNVSIFLALSGLVAFYHATRDFLAWCNPFPKFLCIKGVVFMTFWQGMAIHIIAKLIYQVENPVDWSRRVQNFVICLEMLFFAVAHVFVFPTEEWRPGYRPKERVKGKLGDNIGINDFVKDVKHMVKTRKRHKVRRDRRQKGISGPYADLQLDVASAADGTATTANGDGDSALFCIGESEEAFSAEEVEEEVAQEESFYDDEAEDGEDADDGDYIVIYRSKGRTKVIQDGETIELPPGSADFGRIQDFIESSVHSSSRSSQDIHHLGMHSSSAVPAMKEEQSVARNGCSGTNAKAVSEKVLADDGELI